MINIYLHIYKSVGILEKAEWFMILKLKILDWIAKIVMEMNFYLSNIL